MTAIPREQFLNYETLILTEQMPAARVRSLLDENPDFAEWYRGRVEARRRASLDAERRSSASTTKDGD
ncbi:hypothetical protein [Mesorhizobium sp.]|uniref:hypothetical protein n=1 Tax=Mesorhizobium sp. TaxID=1871066 RepID=UPI0025CD0C46|nr:hypothetical protein [Mesorhizobium sp.]